MTDLFDKRSDKDKLFDWMKSRQWTKTSDVIRWGSENFSNRALRNAQQLAADGLLRRMTEEQKMRVVGVCKEDIWVIA